MAICLLHADALAQIRYTCDLGRLRRPQSLTNFQKYPQESTKIIQHRSIEASVTEFGTKTEQDRTDMVQSGAKCCQHGPKGLQNDPNMDPKMDPKTGLGASKTRVLP